MKMWKVMMGIFIFIFAVWLVGFIAKLVFKVAIISFVLALKLLLWIIPIVAVIIFITWIKKHYFKKE